MHGWFSHLPGRFFRSRRQPPPPILRANHDSCTLHGSREGSWHVRASILYCESSRSLPPQKKGFPLFPSKVASVALSGALNQFVVEREAEISLSSWKKMCIPPSLPRPLLFFATKLLTIFPKKQKTKKSFLKNLVEKCWSFVSEQSEEGCLLSKGRIIYNGDLCDVAVHFLSSFPAPALRLDRREGNIDTEQWGEGAPIKGCFGSCCENARVGIRS